MEIFDIQVHLDILYTAVPRIVKEMVDIDLWAVVAWMNIFMNTFIKWIEYFEVLMNEYIYKL